MRKIWRRRLFSLSSEPFASLCERVLTSWHRRLLLGAVLYSFIDPISEPDQHRTTNQSRRVGARTQSWREQTLLGAKEQTTVVRYRLYIRHYMHSKRKALREKMPSSSTRKSLSDRSILDAVIEASWCESKSVRLSRKTRPPSRRRACRKRREVCPRACVPQGLTESLRDLKG